MSKFKVANDQSLCEQIPLFLDEHILINGVLQDLCNLQLEEARNAFEQYGCLYPRGEDVSDLLHLTLYLLDGLAELPSGGDGAAVICRLWRAFEDYAASLCIDNDGLLAGIKQSLFLKAVALLKACRPADFPLLTDQTPAGYVYLMAGQYDRAVTALQAALPLSPDNAHIYGYLGDAYGLRGDIAYGRACYLEAFLIDPEALDWRMFRDADLADLKKRLQEEEGLDVTAAIHWLAAHAYVAGLFRPKAIQHLSVLKNFVDDYLDKEKIYDRHATAALGGDLFIRAIVLCDNEAILRMVKGIDYVDIRRKMKEINAPLFAAYMKLMKDRTAPRSEQR